MKELQIKTRLVKFLLDQSKSVTLGSEVPFQSGSRRADLVSIEGNIATAFEIKGAEDTTERLYYQIESYKKYFDYCYIVCESSNLEKVRASIGKDIGIFLVSEKKIEKRVRQSKQFKRHDKLTLISTIPTPELRKIAGSNFFRSKQELCEHISNSKSLSEIRTLSRKYLDDRYLQLTNMLRGETLEEINPDDILTITRMPPDSLIKIA